ncbi:hypothetical protein C8R45DRAFT_769046, partial [Mycena sanguinolenta]
MKLPHNTVQSLIDTIYPGISTLSADHHHDKYFLERTIISARNDDVNDLNANLLNKFTGDETVFHSADSVVTE